MKRTRASAGQAGFTLTEVLIVIAIIGLMAVWGVPALLQLLNRIRLTSAAQECQIFMNRARTEAIKQSSTAEVLYLKAADSPNGADSLFAFADLDADGAYTEGTDVVAAGPYPLPKGVTLWGPTDGAPEGANAIVDWDEGSTPNDGPIYNSDGSVQATGAFRFRDTVGNYLEVRILFAGTGKPVVRKWAGGGNPDANWFENGDPDNPWEW